MEENHSILTDKASTLGRQSRLPHIYVLVRFGSPLIIVMHTFYILSRVPNWVDVRLVHSSDPYRAAGTTTCLYMVECVRGPNEIPVGLSQLWPHIHMIICPKLFIYTYLFKKTKLFLTACLSVIILPVITLFLAKRETGAYIDLVLKQCTMSI